MATGSAGTNGFLFCDLRGYAAFVDARGDHAAAELLATYRALVRQVIAAHAGAEIRTEGDSVYVVFPTASAAVEAGLGIVAAAGEASTPERPVRVGVGVHAGETLATQEGPVGGAVNIAARVCARAQAGEVLVTDTVRAITRTLVPYAFVSLGTQQLKGIHGGVALYRVEAVPAGRMAHLRRRLAAHRGRVVVAAAAVAALLLVAAGAWAATRPVDCITLGPDAADVVARIDPGRGCIVATYPTGHGPTHVLSAAGRIWVANAGDRTITALDATTGAPVVTVGIGGTSGHAITAMSAGTDALHVLDGDAGILTTIDLATASVTRSGKLPGEGEVPLIPAEALTRLQDLFTVPQLIGWATDAMNEYAGIAEDQGHVWISNRRTGQLLRDPSELLPRASSATTARVLQVDPAVDPLRAACARPGFAGGANGLGIVRWCGRYAASGDSAALPETALIAFLGQTIWAAHGDSPDLTAYDRDNGARTGVMPIGAFGRAMGLATRDSEVWVAYKGGQVARVRDSSAMPALATIAPTLTAIAADPSGVYVASGDGHELIELDPSSLLVLRRIDVGGQAEGVAIAPDGSVWVTVSALDR